MSGVEHAKLVVWGRHRTAALGKTERRHWALKSRWQRKSERLFSVYCGPIGLQVATSVDGRSATDATGEPFYSYGLQRFNMIVAAALLKFP